MGRPYLGIGGLCNSQVYFRLGNETTRGQMAKIASNAFFPSCNPRAQGGQLVAYVIRPACGGGSAP